MIQIIDYGAGNLQSIKNALEKLGAESEVISSPQELITDAKIIFAGVGAAGSAMANLRKSGFDKALTKLKNPFLGICLGMQLLFERSEEDAVECLGVLKGDVRRFPLGLTVPQIGWNKVKTNDSALFKSIPQESYFYFVNSYYARPSTNALIAETEYGITFCSAVQKENFYGVQFHPEKSGEIGQKILDNFIKLC